MFISNGPVADLVIVFAVTDPPRDTTGHSRHSSSTSARGLSRKPPSGKDGVALVADRGVGLRDVWVPAEAVLGGVGGGSTVFTHAMDWSGSACSPAKLGPCSDCWKHRSVRTHANAVWTTNRKFQAVAHRIVDMKVHLEAARLLVYQAAWRLGRVRTVSMDASIAKLFVSESLVNTALDTVRVHGGYGYMTEYEVERALRDAVRARSIRGPRRCSATSSRAGWAYDPAALPQQPMGEPAGEPTRSAPLGRPLRVEYLRMRCIQTRPLGRGR